MFNNKNYNEKGKKVLLLSLLNYPWYSFDKIVLLTNALFRC